MKLKTRRRICLCLAAVLFVVSLILGLMSDYAKIAGLGSAILMLLVAILINDADEAFIVFYAAITYAINTFAVLLFVSNDGYIVRYSLAVAIGFGMTLILLGLFNALEWDRKLGLAKHKTDISKPIGYATISWIIFSVLICVMEGMVSNSKKESLSIEKQNFTTIEKWFIEVKDGNTVYVIYTKDNQKISVSPIENPEVRDIRRGSKIKLTDGNVTIRVE
ncbi:MAG: hypothetical protein IJ184_06435 [Alphaproteobacteria bacterium]|nr:hypothetical protein [Alphaproteobacteria bacterium]